MSKIKNKVAKDILLKQLKRLEEVSEKAARSAPAELPQITESMVRIAKKL